MSTMLNMLIFVIYTNVTHELVLTIVLLIKIIYRLTKKLLIRVISGSTYRCIS